jgi:DNA-binding NtrC family response regulator
MEADDTGANTEAVGVDEAAPSTVRRFHLEVIDGPQKGLTWDSSADSCSVGSHPSNDLVIDEPTVSRFHCEIQVDARGTRVRDLDSKNGTLLDGTKVIEGFLRGGSLLRLGRSTLRFELALERNRLPLSEKSAFGSLVGDSPAMRVVFALLERAAKSDATVLIQGETGTGKEGTAEAIHDESQRQKGPFVVLDCSAIPENLLESELFGHEKGSFTGAANRRIGAFEEASGGTIFLDEIGELPLDLQPKLLRVLESREVRRVGGNAVVPVDVRVIAATNRDLRAEVNAGRFRSDVYYRLAVVKIQLPPLRSRPEDIPLLAETMLRSLGADAATQKSLTTPEFIAALQRAAWPGNVRELRNYLERCMVFQQPLPLSEATPPAETAAKIDPTLSYAEARRQSLEDFERRYVEALVAFHKGKVSQAARAAGMARVYLYRLMQRHGIKP